MNIAELHKRDPAKNMARSYRIWVTPTLFGDYAVVREWGRIGSPGTVREEWFETEDEALRDGLDLCRRKERGAARIQAPYPARLLRRHFQHPSQQALL